MKFSLFALLLASLAAADVIRSVSAIVCTPEICEGRTCDNLDDCDAGDGRRRIVPNGGFCGCCDACYTELDEGESCSVLFRVRGVPVEVECGAGLYCDPRTETCERARK